MPAPALRRVEDWPSRLAIFLRARRFQPYAYGLTDCWSTVRDEVRKITGTDLMPGVILPTTRFGGLRFLVRGGYRDVEGLATALLGPPLDTPKQAGRGDVVSFWAEGEPHLAIVNGTSAATPAAQGLVWIPRGAWRQGWRV